MLRWELKETKEERSNIDLLIIYAILFSRENTVLPPHHIPATTVIISYGINYVTFKYLNFPAWLRILDKVVFIYSDLLISYNKKLVLILASIPILKTMLSTKSMYDNYINIEIMLFIQKENSRGFILESLFLCWSFLHRVFSIPTAFQYWIGIYKISVSWGNSRASLCHC